MNSIDRSGPEPTQPGAEDVRRSLLERLGVLVFDVESDGVIRAPSAGLRRLFLVDADVPIRLAELMPPGYWSIALEGISGEGYFVDPALELVLPSGASAWVSIALQAPIDPESSSLTGVIQDTSEKREADRSLRVLDAAVQMAEVGVTITDESGRILYTNRAEAEMHGYAGVDELIGKDARMLAPNGRWAGEDAEPLAVRHEWRRQSVNLRRDGEEFPVLIGSDVVRDATGAPIALVSCATDISERIERERDRLHDPLTGLPNRRLLHDRIDRAITERSGRDGDDFALLLVGLNRFRIVNDGLGRESADALLVQVARRLEACMRPTDSLARTGPDEFVLLLHDLDGGDDAVRASIRLQEALAAPFDVDDRQFCVTASIGITLGRAGAATPDDALRQAAIALARAKACGHGCFQLFGREMHEEAVAALELEIALRQGLDAGEFRVAYQPIVALPDHQVVGFEALVRWRNANGEDVSPDEFVPLAEETGLIVDLDRWVLFEACSRLAEWRRLPGGADLTVSVNISNRELLLPGLVDEIGRILARSGLDPSGLRLEITESAVMGNPTAAARVLERIRGLGVKLQLDDFGTGYSSLGQLHQLPLDALKIDRCFVHAMHEERGALFIETIVILAQHLGLSVVAEGVERAEQLHGVWGLGCDYAQGFFISRPLEADDARDLLVGRCEVPPADDALPRLSAPHLRDAETGGDGIALSPLRRALETRLGESARRGGPHARSVTTGTAGNEHAAVGMRPADGGT